MKKGNEFVGINIQFPISQEILSGEKTIETRTYALPDKYVGRTLVLIETPGKNGKFKARAIAKIIFGESFQYPNPKTFYKDYEKHLVDKKSVWAWQDKPKWGWPILKVCPIDPERTKISLPKGGIVFRSNISIQIIHDC